MQTVFPRCLQRITPGGVGTLPRYSLVSILHLCWAVCTGFSFIPVPAKIARCQLPKVTRRDPHISRHGGQMGLAPAGLCARVPPVKHHHVCGRLALFFRHIGNSDFHACSNLPLMTLHHARCSASGRLISGSLRRTPESSRAHALSSAVPPVFLIASSRDAIWAALKSSIPRSGPQGSLEYGSICKLLAGKHRRL